jgi:hypothetical protein
MAFKPGQPSIVPDSYLVMARRPRGKTLSKEFTAADLAQLTQKMIADIRKLARQHGETVQIEAHNLSSVGAVKIRCDRHFAGLVGKLPSVAHVAQERLIQPGHKGPKFNA